MSSRILNRPERYLLVGQLGLLVSIISCALLLPDGLAANDGYSYYGAQPSTVVPYSLGLIVLGWFYLKFARSFPKNPELKPIVFGLYMMIPLFIVAIITPYTSTPQLHWLHVATTISIFITQLLVAVWAVIIIRWDALNVLLLSILAAIGLLAILFLREKEGFLIHTEYAFQLTLAILLLRSSLALEEI